MTLSLPGVFAALRPPATFAQPSGLRIQTHSQALKSNHRIRPAFNVHGVDKANVLRLAGHYQ